MELSDWLIKKRGIKFALVIELWIGTNPSDIVLVWELTLRKLLLEYFCNGQIVLFLGGLIV